MCRGQIHLLVTLDAGSPLSEIKEYTIFALIPKNLATSLVESICAMAYSFRSKGCGQIGA
jgi:hypothetical protein